MAGVQLGLGQVDGGAGRGRRGARRIATGLQLASAVEHEPGRHQQRRHHDHDEQRDAAPRPAQATGRAHPETPPRVRSTTSVADAVSVRDPGMTPSLVTSPRSTTHDTVTVTRPPGVHVPRHRPAAAALGHPDARRGCRGPPAPRRWCRHPPSARRPPPGRRRRRRAARAAGAVVVRPNATTRPNSSSTTGTRITSSSGPASPRLPRSRGSHGRSGWGMKRSIGAAADTVTSKSPIGNTCSTSACTVTTTVGVTDWAATPDARRHRRDGRPRSLAAAALQSPPAAAAIAASCAAARATWRTWSGDGVLDHEPERQQQRRQHDDRGDEPAIAAQAPAGASSAGHLLGVGVAA